MANRETSEADEETAKRLLNRLADRVQQSLEARGLKPHTSLLFRPWNMVTLCTPKSVIATFWSLTGGIANVRWIPVEQDISLENAVREVQAQLGVQVEVAFSLARDASDVDLSSEAEKHAAEIERENRLSRLGDLAGFGHLEGSLKAFLLDHPVPQNNVFLMMRFERSEQMEQIDQVLRKTLEGFGLVGLRADDRAYHDELWANVQTYMLGCQLGIAVFEQIDQREFNPNVSLELGFMLARRRRCLLLKEQRLPALHTDLVGRLYREFDAFHIEATIRAEVSRWLEVDLALAAQR